MTFVHSCSPCPALPHRSKGYCIINYIIYCYKTWFISAVLLYHTNMEKKTTYYRNTDELWWFWCMPRYNRGISLEQNFPLGSAVTPVAYAVLDAGDLQQLPCAAAIKALGGVRVRLSGRWNIKRRISRRQIWPGNQIFGLANRVGEWVAGFVGWERVHISSSTKAQHTKLA